jgi:hypothetical protein
MTEDQTPTLPGLPEPAPPHATLIAAAIGALAALLDRVKMPGSVALMTWGIGVLMGMWAWAPQDKPDA